MGSFRNILCVFLAVILLPSCSSFLKEQKVADAEYRYEAAKAYFLAGQYNRSQDLLTGTLAYMKGTLNGEESLYLLGMSAYGRKEYESAVEYLRKYYKSYPRGRYVELARFYCGRSLYEDMSDTRLDQQPTHEAVAEFQEFIDLYPDTHLRGAIHEMLLKLQDKLIEKDYSAAKLYYNLGSYVGNCTSGGSNFEACIVSCENALREYPYASEMRREELSILLLRARYYLSRESIESKKMERYRATVDEYYAFVNDFPESKYKDEAKRFLDRSTKFIESNGGQEEDD